VIIHCLPYQTYIDIRVRTYTNHQNTSVTIVCCFEHVYILIICIGRFSCLSRNVSFKIHLWMGLLLLIVGMYQA